MPSFTPTCPRCGYDQSGAVDSWKEACPLAGVCSECGFALDWRHVMRPDLLRLRGLYEHGPWWNVRWAWRTWSWAMRPWVFARKVRLEHQPRVGLLLLWLPMLLLPLHLVIAAARITQHQIILATLPAGWMGRQPSPWIAPLAYLLTPVGYTETSWWWQQNQWSYIWYSTARSVPTFVWMGLTIMLTVPLTLALLTSTRAKSKVRAGHLLRCSIYGLAWIVIIVLILAVNAAHGAYVAWASAGSRAFYAWGGGWVVANLIHRPQHLWMWGIAIWSAVWWWYAVVRVLKLHQGPFVWLMMMIIGLLCGLIIGLLIGGPRVNFGLFWL